MTIQECYETLGGSYAQIVSRLPSAKLIDRFLSKFLDDGSYAQLCRSLELGKREEAFRAAHTLKGVTANLSLDRLFHSASRLTELLRSETALNPVEADSLLREVTQDYELTVSVIRTYLKLNTPAE